MSSSQTIHPDYEIYAEQMALLMHGTALWEPSPIRHRYDCVRLGDVGYIAEGQFCLLFHAAEPLGSRVLGEDVPLEFEPLDYGSVKQLQPRLPRPLYTQTVHNKGASLDASPPDMTFVQAGASFKFDLTSDKGAILLTRYPTYRSNAELKGSCMKYTRKHHSSWVQFAEDKGHGAVNPILVTGTDLTLDFAMLAYASLGRSVDVKFSAEATGIASLQASVWGKWAFNGSVHHTCGPQVTAAPGYIPQGNALLEFPDTEDVRPMFDQCVFVRGFRIRKRLGFFPQVMNAAAEAVDLDGDSSDHDASAGGALVASEALDVDSAYVVDDDMPPDIDPLDCIAHYIFKNSDASTCILHDDDCTALIKDSDLQPGESLGDFLARQKPKVTVDADGVASVYLPDKEFAPDSSKVPVVEPITDKATALNSPVSVTLPPGLSRNLLATVFKTVDHSSGSLYAVKIRKRSHFRRGPKLDRAPDEVVLQRLRGRRMDEIQTIFSNDESIKLILRYMSQDALRVVARNHSIVTQIFLQAKGDYEAEIMHHTQIHSFDPRAGWKWHESRPKLPLSSIVLVPDIKDLLLADLKDFTNGQQWYEERGIPFRRGYLLHGARGSGKSSLVYAIAAEMARDVCVLSLGTGTHGISDMEFYESLQQIPPNSILLIEDIDVTLHHAARKDGTALSEQPSHAPSGVGEEASLVQQLTVDGIIKALDSLVSTEGCISFTTCTHLEWVDPSLSRSGRMDVWLEFKDATQWQAEELFCNVFATQYGFGDSVELGAQGERQLDEVGITKLARRFADTIPHEQLSIATLREYLLKHRFDPESAVSDALAWVASELLLRRQAQSI